MLDLIQNLQNNDGVTLKNGVPVRYKSGWQVATEGVETTDPMQAVQAVQAYNGNCGVWYSDGVYYVDRSHRVVTKREALAVGKAHHQISVYGWRTGALAYC